MKSVFLALTAVFLFLSVAPEQTTAQNKKLRVFRGSVAFKRVEMKLTFGGENLSGAYFYSAIGKDISLKGRVDAKGNLSLQEFDPAGKQTGKFICKLVEASDENPLAGITGKWSRPDGTKETDVYLTEQNVEMTSGWQIVTKVEKMPRLNVTFYYPQIVGDSPALANFNRRVVALVSKTIKKFKDGEPVSGRSNLDADYDVLLATNDIISIRFNADTYWGGPYPNAYHYTVNYNLREGREIPLADLFKPGLDYKQTVFKLAVRSAVGRMKEFAEAEGRKEETAPDDLNVSIDEMHWETWAMTRRGLYVYFSLPHVIAALEENFIPYPEMKDMLNPQGPASLLRK
jgi:hypothetical protein